MARRQKVRFFIAAHGEDNEEYSSVEEALGAAVTNAHLSGSDTWEVYIWVVGTKDWDHLATASRMKGESVRVKIHN